MRKLLALFIIFCAAIGHTGTAHTLQVTIGASVTQITTTDTFARQIIFQNNQTHSMRVGDSTTTTSKGALLASGSPGGSMNVGPSPQPQLLNLANYFVAGTNTDVIDVFWTD